VSAAVVATLAFGIGLDVGVFTVVDGVLFRARVTTDPETFVQIDARPVTDGTVARGGLPLVSHDDFLAYRGRASSLTSLAAWTPVHATLRDATSGAEDMLPVLVTCEFFSVYPVHPILGRSLTERDCAAPGRDPVVLMGEQLWRRRYDARPDVVGRTIVLNERSFIVVGVLPDGYDGQLRGPLWIPYTMSAAFFGGQEMLESDTPWLVMVGRLRPGGARAAAAAEMALIARQRDRVVPGRETRVRLTNGSTIDMLPTSTSAALLVSLVMGGLSLVLLIVCANVSTLLLSRAAARRGEIGVRLSLGASPLRLVRMLLIEHLLLALVAAPLGVLVAWQVPPIFRSQIPDLPHYAFGLDLTALLYLAGTSLAVGGLIAIVPLLEALGGRSIGPSTERTGSARPSRTGTILIAVQVAMSVVVVTGAVLLVRGERALRSAPPGFETERVLLARPRMGTSYTPSMTRAYYRRLADQIRAVPGVRRISFASAPPLGDGEGGAAARRVRPRESAGRDLTVTENLVSADYFSTLGLPITHGRALTDEEPAVEPSPVVISEALARTLFPAGDPVGRELVDDAHRLRTVVGVAGDVTGLAGDVAGRFTLYGPRPADVAGDALMVRFEGDAGRTAGAVREALRRLDPDTVVEPRTIGMLRRELADRFLRMVRIVVVPGLAAVALAAIGLYGLASFSAERRTKEMGIRMALGATRADVVAQALRAGFGPVAFGLGLGAAVAAAMAHALQLSLDRVDLQAQSPVTYVAAISLLASIAVMAMAWPALRASRTSPLVALGRD